MSTARRSGTGALGSILAAAVALLVSAGVAGCSRQNAGAQVANPNGYETLELRYQGSAGNVNLAELADDLGYLAPLKLLYLGSTTGGPQNMQAVVTGDTDFGGAFNGAIVKLVAAGAPIKAVVGSYGTDHETWSGLFVLADSPIRSARDLLGKKVAVNTVGAHQEFMIKEYMLRSGVPAEALKDLTLLVVPPVNGEQALRQKQVDGVVLSGISRDSALDRGGIRRLVSDVDLFGTFTAGSFVMSESFMRKNPKTTRKFVSAIGRAIEWARSTPRDEVVARFESIVRKRGRNESVAPLRFWRSTGVKGKGGVLSDGEIQMWIDWLVKDGELERGAIEPAQVYVNTFNSYATARE